LWFIDGCLAYLRFNTLLFALLRDVNSMQSLEVQSVWFEVDTLVCIMD
jgi:hypothetical protein